ncbi:MAG: tetratricopeptide repeat protein [Muribaculaceae bacterium]|nr:tetratricopeptide repeat protein [Muribaculaceae bacterium]
MRKTIETQHKEVTKAVSERRLNRAAHIVDEMLVSNNLLAERERLAKTRETYRYLSDFMMSGANDPGRAGVISDIGNTLLSLADIAMRAERAKDDSGYYYSTLRFNTLRGERVSDILNQYNSKMAELGLHDASDNNSISIRKECESLLERLFNTLYTSLGNESATKDIVAYAVSGYADNNALAVAISAMTLALLTWYDKLKVEALLDIFENTSDDKIRARGLVGLLLALSANKSRIVSDSALLARLSLWQDSIEIYRILRETIRVIVGTRDTERVNNKMKEEVFAELMKLRPEIISKLSENPEDAASLMDINPEWEEILEKSGLNKKLMELSELQSEGADFMMFSFANLKQMPFFNKAVNWFMPFDSGHSELELNKELTQFIDTLSEINTQICDSDVYSLAFALTKMPEQQLKMLTGQISSHIEQMNEELKSRARKSTTPEFDTAVLKYVRDLYRFFKLFRKKEDFTDPFDTPFDFLSLPVVGDMMSDHEVLEIIGNFYFKRGYHKEALPMLMILSEEEADNASLWEKIGYSLEKSNRYFDALDAYNKASLLKTPGPWLTRRLAYTLKKLGRYSEAAEQYENALTMNPENLSLLLSAASAYIEAGNAEAALSHLYHANYISENDCKVLRSLAWVELLSGHTDKSLDIYLRVISTDAKSSDYLNIGHTMTIKGNLREAVNYYRIAFEKDPINFEKAYKDDIPRLVKLGAEKLTMQLLLDQIMKE